MAIARFKIGSTIYTTASLDEVSLKDLITFQSEMRDLGLDESWGDIEAAAEEMAEMTEAEAQNHPKSLLLFGVTVWASRRAAGEVIRFADAVDFPMKDLSILPSVDDRRPGPTKGAASKAKRPKASAPASEHPEADGSETKSSTTSTTQSDDA